jgi:BirA family biotin operon repressor/biotin-[acetyl-CoA-carboxylase] ligase
MSTPSDTRPPLDRDALRNLPAPWSVEVEEALPSTNESVAERARAGAEEGLVVVAEHQTAGRGRLGREWRTPPRAALTFSVLVRPAVEARRWPLLPLLTGLAVVEGIAIVAGPPVTLKWPNDVLSRDGLKVAGLLVERVESPQSPGAVLGVGINVSMTRAELPVDTAGSLLTAGMLQTDRTALLRHVLERLRARYEAWRDGDDEADRTLLREYAARCDTLDREVEVHLPGDRVLRGRATGIGDDGSLLVADDTGTHPVNAGDVVHIRVP